MTWQTVWEAYDVPRLWDAVDLEDDPLGWDQVIGVRRAAELLTGHSETLRAKRENVAQAWQGPTAALMLSRLDSLITSISRDAASLTVAARGLHGIMTALAAARKKIQPLVLRWDEVTGDWIPEFWDEVAAELNDQARTAMLVAAAEVRDHASRLGPPSVPFESTTAVPPPLPGYSPTTSDSPRAGAWLAGMPRPVPAMPGHPVSMLPIPPGNPYAPGGGAYLLPGPGVGPHGFIVPMAALHWRVPKGLPPVILPVAGSPGHPTPETIAGFHDWYSALATPWRAIAPRFAPPA
ncbi:MAG TPA: hypothetical protein VFC19_22035 [Candidatus Limnocylindrales bacterium]|nr:hypothetical protein [Candidatus Limnocylindrales bacterium]